MGDETNMLYTKYYKVIDGNFLEPEHFDIDFDQDGTFDLRLFRGPGPYGAESRVICLHQSCKVIGETVIDTTFFHETYLLSTDPSGADVNIHAMTFSCEMESPDYVFYAAENRFMPIATSINKQISVDDEFLSVSVPFIEPNSSSYLPTGVVNQGVAFYELITHYNDCLSFPHNQETYLGVKLYTPDGVKLGWVKLTVGSNAKIIVKSWAIQE